MRTGDVAVLVPSLSDEGRTWAIRHHLDGPACDCPAFDYSREPKTCKHLAIYLAALHAIDKCQNGCFRKDRDQNTICLSCIVRLLALATRKVRRGYVAKSVLKDKVAQVREQAKARRAKIRRVK